MNRRLFVVALLVLSAPISAPRTAFAQTATQLTRAAELKKEGDALVHALHYRDALEPYAEAFALSHDPAILYNRARALDALDETPQALDAFEEFVRVAPASLKAKVPKLDELIAGVRARVATLTVHCTVEGANVLVRRRLEGVTPLAASLRVSTGMAHVEVQATGYHPFHAEIELGSRAPTTLEVVLVKDGVDGSATAATIPTAVAASGAPLTAAPPNDSVENDSTGSDRWKWGAYSAGGVGIAGIVSGAIFGGLALGKQSSADAACPARTCDPAGSQLIAEARTFATVSTISFVVGGVGLATSALLFLWKPGHSSTQARLMPVISPTFSGLAGTF